MPIFVEVTQRTSMSGPPLQKPPLPVGIAAYRFSQDTGVLLVEPFGLEASLAADVLIGVSTVLLTSDQSYENRELFQFPAEQNAVIHILEFDANTGTVHFTHQGRSYALPPGGRLEFKRGDGTVGGTMIITGIVNHGRASAIQPLTPDGSVR